MSRKHFVAIAEVLRWEYEHADSDDARQAIRATAEALAIEFKRFNTRRLAVSAS